MHQDLEDNYKHKNLVLAILEKALDDICPKYLQEPESIRKELIQERKILFSQQEKQIDLEWKQLIKEAKDAFKDLKKQRTFVISKIEKTRRKDRIKTRLKQLELNKKNKRNSFTRKFNVAVDKLKKEQVNLLKDSKKFAQINKKIDTLTKNYNHDLYKLEIRYNKIIENTNSTNNDEKVDKRIAKARSIWDREKERLEKVYEVKEDNFTDRRLEFDCIRMSLESFIENVDLMEHYCLMVGVSLKTCYKEVKERLRLIGRKSVEIEEILKTIEQKY